MKNLIVLFFGLAIVSFQALGRTTLTLGSAVSLDVERPAETIFVSYPGELSNQCGLRLVVLGGFGMITEDITRQIEVRADNMEILLPKLGNNTAHYDFSHLVLGRSCLTVR